MAFAVDYPPRDLLSRIYEGGLPCRTHLDLSGGTRSTAIHVELHAKIAVTAGLEDAAESEGPGYVLAAEEKVAHLHRVARQPVDDDG